jgi:molybdopterin molybdotransferase
MRSPPTPPAPIGAAEASARILEAIPRMSVESIPLTMAGEHVLAESVRAPVNLPPWRTSSMDGYAVHAADLSELPARLRVVGDVPAGARPAPPLGRGTTVRVMTGAPVPDGADTVVRIEDTDRGMETVTIRDARDAGRNVRPLGEDYTIDTVLAEAGDIVTPALMGVLASAGTATVCVHRRPSVCVVASGDELVMLDQFDKVKRAERIVSSNSYTLPALVREAGAVPRDMGIVHDDPAALRKRIEASRACDLLITTGGISVGERDYTRSVLASLGAEQRFWRVRIRPGGPLAFGILDGRPWIGLSGNPVSAMVTFELYVRPAIRKMLGHSRLFRTPVPVTLDEPVTVSGDLTHFLRVILHDDDAGVVHARLTGTQSSGALRSMALANALLVVPEGRARYEAGETLRALPLRRSTLMTDAFPV